MKKILTLAVLALAISAIGTDQVQAESLFGTTQISLDKQLAPTIKPKGEEKKKKITVHRVADGETLISIAKGYKTSWKRIYYKNKSISNPDDIAVGAKLTIPESTEKLKKRNIPLHQENGYKVANFSSDGKLHGSLGSVSPFGNCVDEPGVNNPGWGNPIDWPVLSQTPTIGATALWTYNHTGVVTGIYEGDQWVEVRHQNYRGGQTKFHISELRGFR